MADSVTINGGKSAAEVAYSLLLDVAAAEGKGGGMGFNDQADRSYILDTFAECMAAARGIRSVRSKSQN